MENFLPLTLPSHVGGGQNLLAKHITIGRFARFGGEWVLCSLVTVNSVFVNIRFMFDSLQKSNELTSLVKNENARFNSILLTAGAAQIDD